MEMEVMESVFFSPHLCKRAQKLSDDLASVETGRGQRGRAVSDAVEAGQATQEEGE